MSKEFKIRFITYTLLCGTALAGIGIFQLFSGVFSYDSFLAFFLILLLLVIMVSQVVYQCYPQWKLSNGQDYFGFLLSLTLNGVFFVLNESGIHLLDSIPETALFVVFYYLLLVVYAFYREVRSKRLTK